MEKKRMKKRTRTLWRSINVVLLLCIGVSLMAQMPRDVQAKVKIEDAKYRIAYSFVIRPAIDENPQERCTDTMMLQIGTNTQKFYSETSERMDSSAYITLKNNPDEPLIFRIEEGTIRLYMDVLTRNTNKIRKVNCRIHDTDYFYNEEVQPLTWETLPETEVVMGYTCQKAQCSYGGRIWYAWYTADIPLNYGPWKLADLPGLILKAQDADTIFYWQAFSIEQPENMAIYENDAKYDMPDLGKISPYKEREVTMKEMDKLWRRRWLDPKVNFIGLQGGEITTYRPDGTVETKIVETTLPDGFYPQFETEFKGKK